MTSETVTIGRSGLDRASVVNVARKDFRAELGVEAREAMAESRAFVDAAVLAGEPVYGINTGFGALAHTTISGDRLTDLQFNLIRSHAAGMGDPVEPEVVRAMMLLRARTLAMGYSGASPALADQLVAVLNAGIIPLVPEHGSLGASGDLAPLAHVAMTLIGEGEVIEQDGSRRSAADALAENGLDPVSLGAKDGLALINGTDGMLGMLCLAVADLESLLAAAEVAAAMSVEGLLGTNRPFRSDLVGLRPHPGQRTSAAAMRSLLKDSEIVMSHRYDDPRVQDAYSLRCAPQVLGAARDALAHAIGVADRELVSAIDNPTVMPDGRIESGGNFHGAPLAHAFDLMAIVAADAGSIAERRTNRMLDPARSEGLPAFLVSDAGVNSGLMIAHYTMAALVAANRVLATPASMDTVSTSASQEDHVSMGWGAGRKLRKVLDNLARIIAVELLAASRALDLRAPLQPGPGTRAVHDAVRSVIPLADGDLFMAENLAKAEELVRSGVLVEAAAAAVDPWPAE